MNLSNILLLAQIDHDTTVFNKAKGVTDSLSQSVDSLLANPENLSVDNISQTVTSFDWGNMLTSLSNHAISFGLRLMAAILVFYVGKFIINKVHKLVQKVMDNKKVDVSLSSFLLSFMRIGLLFLLVITVIAILGIETSSFIAVFASAGVAVGLALSGTLQNFAGGVLILLLKPFKVGDYIVTEGQEGTVTDIQIFNTVILTPNNERILMPNGGLSTSTITNYSGEKYRRVEWRIGISYGDDVAKAREVILGVIAAEPKAVKDAAYPNTVSLESLDDSAVTLVCRGWCLPNDYWDVFFNVNEDIYNEVPKHGLSFPFPQMDIHMDKA
ncbi:MAG: mechanosensitive ion channel [Muribaculaceae bacterium]|nr:mechanosensitive ion channel [Muribaculaceae bacterium]